MRGFLTTWALVMPQRRSLLSQLKPTPGFIIPPLRPPLWPLSTTSDDPPAFLARHLLQVSCGGNRTARAVSKRKPLIQKVPPRSPKIPAVRPCPSCAGMKSCVCSVCKGSGQTPKSGFRAKNMINMQKVVGSKWTSVHTRGGHRHFVARSRKRKTLKDGEVELVNTCGNEEARMKIWTPASDLQNRQEWRCGWVPLEKIEEGFEDKSIRCITCKGSARVTCSTCLGDGYVAGHDDDPEAARKREQERDWLEFSKIFDESDLLMPFIFEGDEAIDNRQY